MNNRLVYSGGYDFSLWGMDKLHPFDAKKFSRAWSILESSIGGLNDYLITPTLPVSNDVLQLAHSSEYVQSLNYSSNIAAVIEVGLARLLPSKVLIKNLLKPIRLAAQGTLMAAEYAVKNNVMVMNLGGGFHHAFADRGEGFCFFADAALAIKKLKADDVLTSDDVVAMIDLDAHRGNGFESFFLNDKVVPIFDMYNFQVYPGLHKGEIDDFPFMIPLKSRMTGDAYLQALKEELPGFLASLNQPKLVFYNAGTDILKGDPLGYLNVEYEQVLERDRYVLAKLKEMAVPTVVLTSGGYTSDSHRLVAECAKHFLFHKNKSE